MIKMKVGDRVIVVNTKFDSPSLKQSGQHGVIIEALGNLAPENRSGFRVRYDAVSRPDTSRMEISYYEEDLIFEKEEPFRMPVPEMELSEIEEAEYLMEELSK